MKDGERRIELERMDENRERRRNELIVGHDT